jgi:hypothetical protein
MPAAFAIARRANYQHKVGFLIPIRLVSMESEIRRTPTHTVPMANIYKGVRASVHKNHFFAPE